jgi:hypothetical protein
MDGGGAKHFEARQLVKRQVNEARKRTLMVMAATHRCGTAGLRARPRRVKLER